MVASTRSGTGGKECKAYAKAGESCADQPCDPEHACDNGTCIALPDVGGDCSGIGFCVSTAYCDTDAGTCAARKPKGAACTMFGQCQTGLLCQEDTCQEVIRHNPGETCSFETCIGGYCKKDGQPTGICTAYVKENETCSDTDLCAPWYRCDETSKTCKKSQGPGLGESCILSFLCATSDLYCNGTTGLCDSRKTSGSCTSSTSCAEGYACNSSTMMCVELATSCM